MSSHPRRRPRPALVHSSPSSATPSRRPSTRPLRTRAPRPVGRAPAAPALPLFLAAPAGAAMSLVPPKPDVLLGVSDRGSTEQVNSVAQLIRQHPALRHALHGLGH